MATKSTREVEEDLTELNARVAEEGRAATTAAPTPDTKASKG